MPNWIPLRSIIFFPFFSAIGIYGQEISIWNEQVISTGQTTGHIATLVITNHTGMDYEYSLPACIIPSSGTAEEKNQTQPMYSKPVGATPIPSGGQTEIPVYGYCLDIFKPPVEKGGTMPPPEQWIKPGITISDPPQPEIYETDLPHDHGTGLIPIDPTSPITGGSISHRPIPTSFDLTYYPQTAAPYIFNAVSAIEKTYYQLKSTGVIKTPFSGDTLKESKAVLQQSIWVCASLMEGKKYVKEDFGDRMITQFQDQTGQPLTPAQTQQLEEGVDQFWETFVLVGIEAKVITIVSDDHPSPPAEVKPGCHMNTILNLGYVMSGGLAHFNYSPTNDAPVAGGGYEKWNTCTTGIILCADGYDSDLLTWTCTPDPQCPETGSELTIPLTSPLRFRWEVESGAGTFSNNRTTDEGECILFHPIPLPLPGDGDATAEGKISFTLWIEDDGEGQPIDPTIMKSITVELRHKEGYGLEYKVTADPFKRLNNFQSPSPGIITGNKKGTCEAITTGWWYEKDLTAEVDLPKDSLQSGELIKISARMDRDGDMLFKSCETQCATEIQNDYYPDLIEWKWEILEGSGSIHSKYSIDGGLTGYGKSIIFAAPPIHDASTVVKLRLTIFNPEKLQLVDRKNEMIFYLPIRCTRVKEQKPSTIWITWQDHIPNPDEANGNQTSKSWQGIHAYLFPPACTLVFPEIMVQETYTHPVPDKKTDTRFPNLKNTRVLKPQQGHKTGSTGSPSRNLTLAREFDNGCAYISNYSLYGGPDKSKMSARDFEKANALLDTLFDQRLIGFDILSIFYGHLGDSQKILSEFTWLVLVYGVKNFENTPEFQKLKVGLPEKEFKNFLEEIHSAIKKYESEHGPGSLDNKYILSNPYFKGVDFQISYTSWDICSKGDPCNEQCLVTGSTRTHTVHGGQKNTFTRNSSIERITPGGNPWNKIIASQTFTHQSVK